MRFTLNEDQQTLDTALDGLIAPFATMPVDFRDFARTSPALDQAVADGGFFDIADVPELGPGSAALAVEKLASLPVTGEFALSMLVRPALMTMLGKDVPRPLALVEYGRAGRFVHQAQTLIMRDENGFALAHPNDGDTQTISSILAYPMGRLCKPLTGVALDAQQAETLILWLQVALAAEMSGLIKEGLNATAEHLRVRRQFGRPLGSFQALRHRLADIATFSDGLHLLMLHAACTGQPGDAALAAFQAQDLGTRAAFDFHQMLGAMGMTLEHPLHLWTYRIKVLLSELGGRTEQAQSVGHHCF